MLVNSCYARIYAFPKGDSGQKRKSPLRQKNIRSTRTHALIIVVLTVVALAASQASAVRVCSYNVLNFPGTTGTARVPDFRTVIDEVQPDVLVVQEMLSQAGVNQFLNNVLNYGTPGLYAAGPFVDGPDTDNALFYKPSVVTYVSHSEIATSLRNISEYVLRPVGYTSPAAEFRVYSMHLKAGSTSSDQAQRLAETTILRNHLNALPSGTCFMLGGDYNLRASTEDSYEKLLANEADNDGRAMDPINRPGTWHDNSSFADIHTQSPRTDSFGGGATGGMDDRFDFLLTSYALDDGVGMEYLQGTYTAFGNDGQHFNQSINEGTNYAVSAAVADALHAAADHVPVFADFELPARLDAPSLLAFGDVAVGTQAAMTLAVENSATAPADDLTYTLSYSSGFSGPTGPFDLPAGDTNQHNVTIDTANTGSRSSSVTIQSDDPDHPSWGVSLTGTVVNHAQPSLASGYVVTTGSLDFGSHAAGDFADQQVSVWNYEYDSLQAMLNVYSAEIVGGDDRFHLTGGTIPVDLGAGSGDFTLQFDDSGATEDYLYTAALTFHSRDDQDVLGGTVLSDLTVTLTAYVQGGTGVPDEAPSVLSLAVGSRNPFSDRAELVLSMPSPGNARVDVFDVRGRLVTTLTSGTLPSGEHRLEWNGADRSGHPVSAGIYFVRAQVDGWRSSKKLVLMR